MLPDLQKKYLKLQKDLSHEEIFIISFKSPNYSFIYMLKKEHTLEIKIRDQY